MASSSKSTGNDEQKDSDKLNIGMKELRKRYCADGTMDRFKAEFEKHLKNIPQHQENIKKIHTLMDSGNPSYEQVFAELAGPAFKGDEDDDLDTILKKVAKMEHVTLSSEEKDKLFESWSEMQRNQHRV